MGLDFEVLENLKKRKQMELTKQQQNSVQASGGALALFLDVDGDLKLKDLRGNIQLLTDFLFYNEIVLDLTEKKSIYPKQGKNTVDGEFSNIGGGDYNVNRGDFSVIGGGNGNSTLKKFSTVGGGSGNSADNEGSFVGGGKNNHAKGDYSSVVGGQENNINDKRNAHIVGSNIEADRDDATFVNNLSIMDCPTSAKGLPKGSIWSNKGVLSIV
jgi:hypothetical protein